MFNPNTLSTVAPLAQALSSSNRALVLHEGTPASEVAGCYNSAAVPSGLPYSPAVAQVSQEDFEAANAQPLEADGADFDRQVDLMAQGIQAVGYNTRNVIIPTVETLVSAYNERQSGTAKPQIEVNVFKYDPVHSDPRLTNHLASKYAAVKMRPEYPTFLLNPASPEQIIEMVSTENPHLDQPQVTEWLLGVGSDRIQAVWQTLFQTARVLDPRRIGFLMPSNLPRCIDELLLAYCLVGHFIEHPQDVVGESVTLEQWSATMLVLHELFGATLLKAYEYRAEDIRQQRLVIEYSAVDPIKTRTVLVLANGDVYPTWSANGGDIEALLGAAVYEPNLRYAAQIDAKAEELAARWQKLYPLLDGACKDYSLLKRRENLAAVFLQPGRALPEALPQLAPEELQTRLQGALQSISNEELEDPYNAIGQLTCKVYYPNPIYDKFLKAYEARAQIHPGADGREIAAEAYIDIAAQWLAQQGQVVPFRQHIDPTAVAEAQALADTPDNEQAVDQAENAAATAEAAVEATEVAAQAGELPEATVPAVAPEEQTAGVPIEQNPDLSGNTDTSESTPLAEEQGGVVPTVSQESDPELQEEEAETAL